MTELRDDPGLLARLRAAARTPTTPEQRHRQKVSFIVGAVGSNITQAQVEQLLQKQEETA